MGEYRTTRGQALPATAKEKHTWIWRTVLAVLAVCAAVGYGGHRLQLDRYAPATGYVTTERYAEVRAPVAGQVTAIAAGSGDMAAAGDLLVQLEDTEQRAAVAEAEVAVRKAAA